MIIAQISDTHIVHDAPDAKQRIADFEAVIADINSLDPQPDVIVHTGDVVHTGHEDEYRTAAEILERAVAPAFVMMGNKDDREKMRQAFGQQGYFDPVSPFVDYTIDAFALRLLMLDTSSPDTNKGEFCQQRLSRLLSMLAENPQKPVVIFAHHPPIEVSVGPEPLHFEKPVVLRAFQNTLLAHADRIKGLFCGHVHRSATGTIGSIPVSIMSAVATPLRRGDYPAWMAGRPAYQIHRLDAQHRFVTETRICAQQSRT